MHRPVFSLGRTIWMVSCLLVLLCFATAPEARQPIGPTANSQRAGAAQNRKPSVHRWLSALHESTVQVWTREHRWFLRPCSRVSFPLVMTDAHRAVDDGDAEASDTMASASLAPLALLLWPWPQAPGLAASKARTTHTAPACRSFRPIDSFLPRPPPTRTTSENSLIRLCRQENNDGSNW